MICTIWKICTTVLLIFCFFLTAVNCAIQKTETCKPLTPSQNVEITCGPLNSTTGTKTITCTYKCKQYYTPFENPNPSSSNEIRCDSKSGNWTNLHKFQSFSCVEDCGQRVQTPKPLIVHGNLTNSSIWPWHAALFRKSSKSSSWHYICGGSLIRNSVILTAAHCVTKQNGELNDSDQFRVILGPISSDFSVNQHSKRTQIFEVRKIYVSAKHDTRSLQADIALIHLTGDVRFNDHVLPICLPNEYALDLNAVKPGRFGDVVGYGVDETGTVSEKLKHAMLRVVSDSECFDGLKRIPSESQFCAGDMGSNGWATVCNGDSGGGFVVPSSVHKKYFIHGIVSSGADKNKKNGVCQNYSIFTHVFQFIFWIRDTLEQISGEVIRELGASKNLAHVQRGTETTFVMFSGIPRDYDNLITTIELVYCEIDPDVFFRSLEFNKGLQYLNLTHVKFTSPLTSDHRHRVVLPHLKTFIMHIPEYLHNVYPHRLTKSQLKSLLFFDKEYDDSEEWPLEKITHLNVNIALTVFRSKLINVNHETGRITWTGQDCSQIIQNLPPHFQLRHLALRRCYLNISRIYENRSIKNLESLVMQSVSLTGGRWSDLMRGMRRLEELRITITPNWDTSASESDMKNKSDETIYLTSLPSTLRHLYLARANVKLLQSESQILFHENSKMDPIYFRIFLNLEEFICYDCSMDSEVIQNFVNIFQSVKKIVLIGYHPVNITNMILNMHHLEYIILYQVEESSDDDDESRRSFIGLEQIPLEFSGQQRMESGRSDYTIKKLNGRWVKSYYNVDRSYTKYIHSGFESLWTSYEEYTTISLLKSFEKSAFHSGQYRFDGNEEKLERFPIIPEGLQYDLKSIQISNAQVLPKDLLESLENADNLEFLILDRVRLNGVFDDTKELPYLKKFRLNTIQDPNYNFKVLKEDALNFLVPIGRSYLVSEEKMANLCWDWSNETSTKCHLTTEVRRFDYKPRPITKQEYGSMESFEILHDKCVTISVDYKVGKFIYSMEFSDDTVLIHLNETNMKHLSLHLSDREWNLVTIPTNVEYLNLYKSYPFDPDISNIISNLLLPLDSLRELRIMPSWADRHRTQINLFDLKNTAHQLKLMSFDQVHVKYSQNIRFDKVETLYFEACTFDESVEENFFDDIFPAVKFVNIVSILHNESAVLSEASERLLIQALKNERVNRVLGQMYISSKNGHNVEEIKKILSRTHVPNFIRLRNAIAFQVERRNGEWMSVPFIGSDSRKAAWEWLREIHRLRGDLEFGDISCGYNYYDYYFE